MLNPETINPNDLYALLSSGNCLRCGVDFVGGQLVYFVLPPGVQGVLLPVCVRCVNMDPSEEYANIMCRYGTHGIPRGMPTLYGHGGLRGWLVLFELADGSWRVLLRDAYVHLFPPQVADDPTFPWWTRDPAGLVYSTDGLHRVMEQANAHAMGVPGCPIVRIVPVDVSHPQAYPEQPDPGQARDRMEFWSERQVRYYPEPLTPVRMRQEAQALMALITRPGIDWHRMAGWRVLAAGMILSEPAAPMYRRHPILRFFPTVDQDHGALWPMNEVLAACRFMRLPLAGREVSRLPRQQRRALERAGKPVHDVQVIVLRRTVDPHEGEDRESDIEWSCHWLVKGHWRRQWHPSRGEHRPIYIDAHLKGDFEKPFRPPRQKLYVVAR